MWRTVPGVRSWKKVGRAAVPVPPSLCAPTCPGGEQATHTALLRLFEFISLLTTDPKKILFEATPLGPLFVLLLGWTESRQQGGVLWGSSRKAAVGRSPE